MKWWQLSICLCCYGFFKEFRPSEPYITPFLTDFKNFTIEEVNQGIYPLGTYFYLFLLVAVFLLTDYLKYKPVIFIGSLSGVVTWCLLIFGKTILEMQIVEFFYGFFMASEVAYYSYIYAKVNKIYYQKVTSHTRAAILLGKACAGGTSQLFVFYKLLNFLELNYLSVCGVGIATFFAIFLPTVQESIYFNSKKIVDKELNDAEKDEEKNIKKKDNTNSKCNITFCYMGFEVLFKDLKQIVTNSYIVHWSIWWALATCGYLQVISYCQILWQEIVREANVTLYHGLVELASSLLGASVAFTIGYVKLAWNLWGETILGILTVAQGSLLFLCSLTNEIYIAYALHLTYHMFYQAAITVATYEIAKQVTERSYALVFGICTFLALVVQTILTIVVINTLKTNIKDQFKIYGGYHFFIGLGFLVVGIWHIFLVYFKRKGISNQV